MAKAVTVTVTLGQYRNHVNQLHALQFKWAHCVR
jgi:hypothetical protein